MYTIQQACTTGPSAMQHIPAPREREPVASEFFIYTEEEFGRVHLSGVYRDIWVSEAGFRRFFEIPEDDHLEGWWMVINRNFSETVQVVGKIFPRRGNKSAQYRITYIDRSHGALMNHAVRTEVAKEN